VEAAGTLWAVLWGTSKACTKVQLYMGGRLKGGFCAWQGMGGGDDHDAAIVALSPRRR